MTKEQFATLIDSTCQELVALRDKLSETFDRIVVKMTDEAKLRFDDLGMRVAALERLAKSYEKRLGGLEKFGSAASCANCTSWMESEEIDGRRSGKCEMQDGGPNEKMVTFATDSCKLYTE